MEANYRKTYTLRAQTPLLHFQADQPGACLRASEVKPRLDAYIHTLEEIPAHWAAHRRKSLLYQMRIIATEDCPDIPRINTLKANFSKEYALVFRNCQLEILCFIPDLLEVIDRHIQAFFILHNFGARQSKGFGSFLVEGTEKAAIEKAFTDSYPHGFHTDFSGSVGDRLNVANAVYTIMKNGINMTPLYPNAYIKGYAVGAFLPQGIGSDKAFIKTHIFPADDGRDYPREGFTYIRALLGFAETYDFRDKYRNNGTETRFDARTNTQRTALKVLRAQMLHYDGTTVVDGKLSIPLESIAADKGIRRFQSPVLIKIIGDKIWFLLSDSWKLMLGQTFIINKKSAFLEADQALRAGAYPQAQEILEQFPYLSTPDTFDPEAFISGFVDYFNSPDVRAALGYFPRQRADSPRGSVGMDISLAAHITLKKL